MNRNAHPAGPSPADLAITDFAVDNLAIDDERDISTARIFTLLCIASALFWGGVGFALYAVS